MNITIVTIGSHGDVVPYLTLSKGLVQQGHTVRIAAFSKFEGYIKKNGFQFVPLTGDADEVIRRLIGVNVNPIGYFSSLESMLKRYRCQLLVDIFKACQAADAVVYSVLGSIAWIRQRNWGYQRSERFPAPWTRLPIFLQ
jgi:sterol 3beta-glucosyltransferase